jgi:transposase
LLESHACFTGNSSKLERLAQNYKIRIIWLPKFHCELNPIEGVWCYLKRHVRMRNTQDWKMFFPLVVEVIDMYTDTKYNIKLWHRFWKALELYNNNLSYQEVLQVLFGSKSKETVSHKKITNLPS